MLFAFSAGFTAVYLLLGLDLLPALLVGTALTATSVGVSVATWQEAGAIGSDSGRLTLDVAELDDIGGILIMALVFALIPVLEGGGSLWAPVTGTLLALLAKLAAFAVLCYLFARYLVEPMLAWAARTENTPDLMIMVAGIGFAIAALAGWLGFSLAIGALFAGLVFSHNRTATRAERSFRDLYAFLTPFFFINIGYHVDPASLGGAAQFGGVLLTAAVLGKLVGVGIPAWRVAGAGGALLIAVSMLPRAEIAMIVMHQARSLGEGVISNQLYAGMVLVSAVTCLLTPLALRFLMARVRQR
jgi:Kef-type K+ transport system membrane component KefB